MKSVSIGEILKPQGIKGEVKIKLFDASFDCKNISSVILDNKEFIVENIRNAGEFLFIKFKGVDTCLEAEYLRGKLIYLTEEDAKNKLSDNEFYADHIMGFDVVVDGKNIGKLDDIQNFGSADIFYIKDNSDTLLLPFVKDLIESIDTNKQIIYLNKDKFNEVAVYEDWYFITFSRDVFGTKS